MAEKDVARDADLQAHIRADWKIVHSLLENLSAMFPLQSRARFRAYASAAQDNLAYNTWVKVVLGTANYNPGGHFSTSTSTFTAPSDGQFVLTGQIGISTAQILKDYYVAIYVNGSSVSQTIRTSSSDGDNTYIPISDIIEVASGDLITLYIQSKQGDSTADIITGSINTFLAGHILSF